MHQPFGDWKDAVHEAGLFKNEPTYAEVSLDTGVELRYNNLYPLEYKAANTVQYSVILTPTVNGVGRELFGRQEKEIDKEQAKQLFEENTDRSWRYVE